MRGVAQMLAPGVSAKSPPADLLPQSLISNVIEAHQVCAGYVVLTHQLSSGFYFVLIRGKFHAAARPLVTVGSDDDFF
jgi:hypothetical protein